MAKSTESVVEAESGRRTAETHKLGKGDGERRKPPIAECGMRKDELGMQAARLKISLVRVRQYINSGQPVSAASRCSVLSSLQKLRAGCPQNRQAGSLPYILCHMNASIAYRAGL